MNEEELEKLVDSIHYYVTDNLPLSNMSDEELENQIQIIVNQRCAEYGFVSMEQRVSVCEQVFSAIRGFGILDLIMKDDNITEVMINGPKDIFIEKKGKLQKLNKEFEDERRLEDIIHERGHGDHP